MLALALFGCSSLGVGPSAKSESAKSLNEFRVANGRTPLMIERINMFFGRCVVARLALVQGTLPLATPPRRAPPVPLGAEEAKALDTRLAQIADLELRAALAGLGHLVLAGKGRGD